ncbi:MAG: YafY family transcriptional regulator [Chloroflexi bacterium]|nr:YafY family transcriptional regulator [Chloroflexota bacterium]
MANTSSRMLRLLSLLQTHRYWPGAELADRLGISARSLRRDVDRLRELGYPVTAHRGVAGGYQLAAGAALPPLLLDDDEAVALAIGLRAAAQGAIAGIEDASVRALAKVVQVMPPRLRRRVDALRSAMQPAAWSNDANVDPGVLTVLAQACRDEERVRFTYTAQNGEQTARHVEPHRLVALGRRWYLVAYDLRREDWRSFRLDRIEQPRSTEIRFQPRQLPAEDAVAFVRANWGAPATQHRIEVIVYAPPGRVRGMVGQWANVEEIDAERTRLRMTADTLDWPAFALGMLRTDFLVVSPPELVQHVQEWSERFARCTDSTFAAASQLEPFTRAAASTSHTNQPGG